MDSRRWTRPTLAARRVHFEQRSIAAPVIPAATRVAFTTVGSVGVIIAAFALLVVFQLVALFFLVLSKRPAIPVIPALLSLVLLQIALLVALMVPPGIAVIIVLGVGLSPLSMSCGALKRAIGAEERGSLLLPNFIAKGKQ